MNPPEKKLVFLISSSYDVGHVNACAGVASELIRRGHRVIFVIEQVHKGTLAPLGIEEYIYSVKKPEGESKPGELSAKMFLELGLIGPSSPLEKI